VKTAWSSVLPGIVGPDFFSSVLVQCVELTGARTYVQKIATDRGLGKDSTSGFHLPYHPALAGLVLTMSGHYCGAQKHQERDFDETMALRHDQHCSSKKIAATSP
jgi:hypothetical protein